MQDPDKSPSQPDRKAANVRLGLILFSIVVVFFLGFFAKMILLG
ncbi:cytochrome oxidase small assembly protein [Cupriavidus sp. 30B13]